jgi:tripartite-type tricarboxylate transporter receptor subunit TctC
MVGMARQPCGTRRTRNGRVVLLLVWRPDLPVADPKALMAMLQAKPGGYSCGSPGVGTADHLN